VKSNLPSTQSAHKQFNLNVAELSGETVDVYIGDNYLFTATVGRKGDVKISKDSQEAYQIMENTSIVTLRHDSETKT